MPAAVSSKINFRRSHLPALLGTLVAVVPAVAMLPASAQGALVEPHKVEHAVTPYVITAPSGSSQPARSPSGSAGAPTLPSSRSAPSRSPGPTAPNAQLTPSGDDPPDPQEVANRSPLERSVEEELDRDEALQRGRKIREVLGEETPSQQAEREQEAKALEQRELQLRVEYKVKYLEQVIDDLVNRIADYFEDLLRPRTPFIKQIHVPLATAFPDSGSGKGGGDQADDGSDQGGGGDIQTDDAEQGWDTDIQANGWDLSGEGSGTGNGYFDFEDPTEALG